MVKGAGLENSGADELESEYLTEIVLLGRRDMWVVYEGGICQKNRFRYPEQVTIFFFGTQFREKVKPVKILRLARLLVVQFYEPELSDSDISFW